MDTSESIRTWVIRSQPRPDAALRLFALPYAGAGASIYRRWADMHPNVEVCAIQLPGRESRFREPARTEMPPLVDALVQNLAPLLDRPFALFGHSMGGLIAFELARTLRRTRNQLPACLFIAACREGRLLRGDPPIHDLPDDEFLDRVGRRYGAIPDALRHNRELAELVLPTLRADFALLHNYANASPRPTGEESHPLACPIVALGGADDACVSREALAAWSEHTTAGFAIEMFPGDHFFLRTAETQLLDTIRRRLA